MTQESSLKFPPRRYKSLVPLSSRSLNLLSLLAPALVIFAWAFSVDISQTVFFGLPTMVPLTAVCILLLAFSNLSAARKIRWAGNWAPAAAVVLITSGLLLNYFVNYISGKTLSATGNPAFSQVSPQSCLALLAIGFSHFLLLAREYTRRTSLRIAFQVLNGIAFCISFLAELGYIYSITALFGLSNYIGMSILTGLSIGLLAVASFRLDSTFGLIRYFSLKNNAGAFIRNFVVGGVFAPFVVAGFIRWAEIGKGLDTNYGMATFVFFTVFSTLILGMITVRSLERNEHHKIKISLQEVEVAEANEAGKLREKFLANMSHEVRTPLTAILGYLDFLDEDETEPHDRREYTKRATRSAKSLLRVLDDILDLSKSSVDQLKMRRSEFSIRDLTEDVISQFFLEAKGKDLAVNVQVDGVIPEQLLSDPNRIQQILTNLLSNSIKFTERGEIRMKIAFETEGASARGWLDIDVTDTGLGIPKDAQKRLFTNFYQVDDSITRRFGGSGIGLALSERLATMLGGRLELTWSELGRGSTFHLRLPCETPVNLPKAAVDRKKDVALPLNGQKILVVDDNIDNQFLISRYLTSAGAVVETAENGAVGIDKASRADYSAILMDIQMPVMGGLEATRTLRGDGYNGVIIALSAHASDEHAQRSLAAGCNAHEVKPINKAELIRILVEFQLGKTARASLHI